MGDKGCIVRNENEVIPESPAYEQALRESKKKRNLCPRARPHEYGRLSKMATSPAGLDASRIHCSSTYRRVEQSWRGVHSCAVHGGLLPLALWRFNSRLEHLVITDSSFSFLPLSLISVSMLLLSIFFSINLP